VQHLLYSTICLELVYSVLNNILPQPYHLEPLQLDSTKTMDKKKSFLDVLVQAVHEKFPHLLSTSAELSQVSSAERSKWLYETTFYPRLYCGLWGYK